MLRIREETAIVNKSFRKFSESKMTCSSQPEVNNYLSKDEAPGSAPYPGPHLSDAPKSTEVPLHPLCGSRSCVNPNHSTLDTQIGGVRMSRPPDGKTSTSDFQLPDTQNEMPESLEPTFSALLTKIPDALLPETQCASRTQTWSGENAEKMPTENQPLMLSSKSTLPPDFQFLDPLSESLSDFVRSDSGLPSTWAATQELLTIQNSYPKGPSALDIPLSDTLRDTQEVSGWINEELSCLPTQLSATQSSILNPSPFRESIIAINDNSSVSDQGTHIATPLKPRFPASSLPTPSPEKQTSYIEYINNHHRASSFISTSSTQQKLPTNKLSVRERKRIVCSFGGNSVLTTAMRLWIRNTHRLLNPFREDDDCWLHPSPPRGRLSMAGSFRPHGRLQKTFIWHSGSGRHSLVLNYGIVSKLVYHTMNKQQLDGFINKQWHLSHLCGNWICVNPKHTTVEPGNVNISRNTCFSHRCGCPHNPPCLKEKKIALNADGKPIDHNASIATYEVVADDWDDWSVRSFDDDETFIMDENEESFL